MAFSYTQRANDAMGRGIAIGNWTAASVTAGTIKTGFNKINHVELTSNVAVEQPIYTATGGDIAITVKSSDSGTYMAYGE